jgi:Na+/H+-dicarboxylate symporter
LPIIIRYSMEKQMDAKPMKKPMPPKKNPSSWWFSGMLLTAVGIGSVIGYSLGPRAGILKPLGDVFLNLLYCAVVPLVFFSIASSVAAARNLKRLGRIAGWMLLVFVITGVISSCLMIAAVKFYDPAEDLDIQMTAPQPPQEISIGQKIADTLTVNSFTLLFNRENMLALILFALLTGLAAQAAGPKARSFRAFLVSGSVVMGQVIKLIMLYAPLGLGAYFAYLVGGFGPQLLGAYGRALILYYPLSILYFLIGFSVYAILGGGWEGFKRFWTHIWPASMTAFGTGSSLAALPSNLEAAAQIGVPEDIRKIVLPLGATIHMDGTCLAAILKIAILFALFGRDFSGPEVLTAAVGAALLAGTVMSGIPGGGYIGEMLIVALYGFGPEALPVIALLGTLVDPPATMVNATGDTVAAMIVARLMEGKQWLLPASSRTKVSKDQVLKKESPGSPTDSLTDSASGRSDSEPVPAGRTLED